MDFEQVVASEPREGYLTLPCFPLGDMAYVPETQQGLNIFEPRYRQMYSDILLSGGRRFVVPQLMQDESGVHLAEVGVVFYLDDLKEVSEQTNDQVKYVCSHSVIGRVRLKRVLNPRAFADRSTYLRVEAEDFVDSDEGADCEASEEQLLDSVRQVGELQRSVGVEVQFKEDWLENVNATRGAGFWGMVSLWQDYLTQRAQQCQKKFERELQTKVQAFLKETKGEVPDRLSLPELPPALQKEIVVLRQQFQEEVRPLMRAQSVRVQELIQTASHGERLTMFDSMVQEEKKRFEAQLALKSIFGD